MASFRKVRAVFGPQGFHCHHLIPISIVEKPAFAAFFRKLKQHGFNPDDFQTNGMLLPCAEINAAAFALPLHRGPHPKYNQMLADFIHRFENVPIGIASRKIHEAQCALQNGLRGFGCRRVDAFRSPLYLEQDFRTIEKAADALASSLNWY